jgi:uncharacterized protein YvpB
LNDSSADPSTPLTIRQGELVDNVFSATSLVAAKPSLPADPPVTKEKPKPANLLLEAPAIKQYPELLDGCEVTSLAMLLQYLGFNKSKLDLAYEMPKDTTPPRYDNNGNIEAWGDPNAGLLPLLKSYMPEAIDLTGMPFDLLERQVAAGYPVIVWRMIDFAVPDRWVTWESPNGPVRTTFAEHAVLLVGYDEANVYVNNPVKGKKNSAICKAQFLETWKAMGKQALSYKT